MEICQAALQKCKTMDWDDLRYVLAAGREGSLARAARRLGVNPSTVYRRIGACEERLGMRLFDRADGRLQPTSAGTAVISRAARIEDEVRSIADDPDEADRSVAGTVRITSVPTLVNRLLIPALPRLLQAHPRLQVDLVAEARNLDLNRRDADMALRLARPETGDVLARRIGTLKFAVHGPSGASPQQLPWIGYESASSHLPQAQWLAAQGGTFAPVTVSDVESAAQATKAGLGKTLLPTFYSELEEGLEVTGEPVLARELWLLVHRDLRRQARIGAAITWLESLVAAG